MLTIYPMRLALPLAPSVVEGNNHRKRETSQVSSSRDTGHRSRITGHQSGVTSH